MIEMDSYQHFYNPRTNNEKRKVLVRSVGSFSVVEENIIVPTPRKLPTVLSPKSSRERKDNPAITRATQGKRKNSREDLLFGEAGSELLNILLQPLPQLLVEECSPKLARVKSPPLLRASNPITMNSEFEEEKNAPDVAAHQPIVPTIAKGNEATKAKDLRVRSASWPGFSKASTKKTEKS